jgi:hypothetical protein
MNLSVALVNAVLGALLLLAESSAQQIVNRANADGMTLDRCPYYPSPNRMSSVGYTHHSSQCEWWFDFGASVHRCGPRCNRAIMWVQQCTRAVTVRMIQMSYQLLLRTDEKLVPYVLIVSTMLAIVAMTMVSIWAFQAAS